MSNLQSAAAQSVVLRAGGVALVLAVEPPDASGRARCRPSSTGAPTSALRSTPTRCWPPRPCPSLRRRTTSRSAGGSSRCRPMPGGGALACAVPSRTAPAGRPTCALRTSRLTTQPSASRRPTRGWASSSSPRSCCTPRACSSTRSACATTARRRTTCSSCHRRCPSRTARGDPRADGPALLRAGAAAPPARVRLPSPGEPARPAPGPRRAARPGGGDRRLRLAVRRGPRRPPRLERRRPALVRAAPEQQLLDRRRRAAGPR
jgi:hypothetical protein